MKSFNTLFIVFFIFFALLGGILRIIFAYFSSKVNTVVSTNISNKIFMNLIFLSTK